MQTGGYTSPLRRPEAIELSAHDVAALGLVEGEDVVVSSRRGEVIAPVAISAALRPGLAFMTLHFPEQVETNRLTIEAVDPKSGTAEFKATAIRIDKLDDAARERLVAGNGDAVASPRAAVDR